MFDQPSYDQAHLDSQYNNRLHVPHYRNYLDRWERQSRETERTLPVVKDIPYGDLPRERLDVYPAAKPKAKTLVFIHGGYWQMLDKSLFHFLAGGFRAKGITTVYLTYPLAPEASLDQIVLSCHKAVQWLYQHVADYNGDPHQLYVAGHSAGGHLAAMMVATDWKGLGAGVPGDVLKGACFVSGLFDLVPIRLSYLNKVLGMDEETALRNSPVRLEPLTACPLIVAVGDAETTAFQEQSRALYKGWKEKGSKIEFLPLLGLNHYSVVEAIVDSSGSLHEAICELMGV